MCLNTGICRERQNKWCVHMSESPAGSKEGSNHAVGRHKNGVKEVVQLDQFMNNNHYDGG